MTIFNTRVLIEQYVFEKPKAKKIQALYEEVVEPVL